MTKPKTVPKEKRGPKSDNYTNIIIPNLQMIEGMFRAGATREDVADALKIGVSTFYEYQKRTELMEAIKNGERGATGNVVAALYKKALKGGSDGMGDTTAQIFWLKNKDPERWRDKQDFEHSGEIRLPNVVVNYSTLETKTTKAEKRK